jgi:hypothetical protein
MNIGTTSVHPSRIVFAILNSVAGLISVAACSYGLWFILSDLSHITFTRCIVLLFCIYLGALSVATTIHRIRVWRRILVTCP